MYMVNGSMGTVSNCICPGEHRSPGHPVCHEMLGHMTYLHVIIESCLYKLTYLPEIQLAIELPATARRDDLFYDELFRHNFTITWHALLINFVVSVVMHMKQCVKVL